MFVCVEYTKCLFIHSFIYLFFVVYSYILYIDIYIILFEVQKTLWIICFSNYCIDGFINKIDVFRSETAILSKSEYKLWKRICCSLFQLKKIKTIITPSQQSNDWSNSEWEKIKKERIDVCGISKNLRNGIWFSC